MSTKKLAPSDLIPLTPAAFNILLSLVEGEKHGYNIMLDVKRDSSGNVPMGPGTLYGSIKRMLTLSLIAESEERPDPALDDQRRRYYKLTGLGGQVLRLEAERLVSQVSLAKSKHLLTTKLNSRA